MTRRSTPNVNDLIEVLLAWRTDRVGQKMTLNFGNGGPRFRMLVELRESFVAFAIQERKKGSKTLVGRVYKGRIDNVLDASQFEVEVRQGLRWLASCVSVDDKDLERDVKRSFANMATLPSLIEDGYWTKPRLTNGQQRRYNGARRMAGSH